MSESVRERAGIQNSILSTKHTFFGGVSLTRNRSIRIGKHRNLLQSKNKTTSMQNYATETTTTGGGTDEDTSKKWKKVA
jgi:hypothetical protein